MKKMIFYFDESFHSRKINYATIKASEYYDNYVACAIGINEVNLLKEKQIMQEFEDKNKNKLSIGDSGELKSSVVKKKEFQYGLATFKPKSFELYEDFWNVLEKIDFIPYIFVSNKLEYILGQMKFQNNDVIYRKNAFIYTISKFINVYRPERILDKLLKNDQSIIEDIKDFLYLKVEENKNNPIKTQENLAFRDLLKILNKVKTENINFNWNYEYVFRGLEALLNENNIFKSNTLIIIDKEGNQNNTISDCIKCEFNAREEDSKENIGIRFADLLSGYVSKTMRAIYEDTKFEGEKYDKKNTLSKNWFNVNKQEFNLYKKIANILKVKFKFYWNTCISIYFDIFYEFVLLNYYFDIYRTYEEFNVIPVEQHQKYFEGFILNNIQERFKEFN